MKNRNLQDIVHDIVGHIYPIGSSEIDEFRRENLNEYLELFQVMSVHIHNIAMKKGSPYHYEKVMGEDAYKVMKEMIDYFSEFYKQEND